MGALMTIAPVMAFHAIIDRNISPAGGHSMILYAIINLEENASWGGTLAHSHYMKLVEVPTSQSFHFLGNE
jgi:hypothetical protein